MAAEAEPDDRLRAGQVGVGGREVGERVVAGQLVEQREAALAPRGVVRELGARLHPVVEVGRERVVAERGEPLADVADVRGHAEQLVGDEDAAAGPRRARHVGGQRAVESHALGEDDVHARHGTTTRA